MHVFQSWEMRPIPPAENTPDVPAGDIESPCELFVGVTPSSVKGSNLSDLNGGQLGEGVLLSSQCKRGGMPSMVIFPMARTTLGDHVP